MKRQVNKKIGQVVKTNFIMLCLDALQRGYDKMIADGQYVVDWKEDKLTAHLVDKIKLTGFLRSQRISVNHQPPIYNEGVVYGEDDPAEAPRVDFKLTKWYVKDELDYYAEAKNLSEYDWDKSDGAKVIASKYKARYIDTGIENFLSGRYPEGCLLGYIVRGETARVIDGINKLITTRNLAPRIGLIEKDKLRLFPICYSSSHETDGKMFNITHLFMQFYFKAHT